MKTLHVVALSGGKDSTAMAIYLHATHTESQLRYVCTPTGREPPEMFEHWKMLGNIFGRRIEPIMHPLGLDGLIQKYNALPNWRQRWCTRELKIEPFENWLKEQVKLHDKVISYVGLRYDEPDREGGDYSAVDGVEMRYPLRELKWGIKEVMAYLESWHITIPKRTDCDCCFFQRLGEWRDLYQEHPDLYAHAVELEEKTGHTFRSPGRDKWPAKLSELAKEFDKGREIRGDKSALQEIKCRVCRI